MSAQLQSSNLPAIPTGKQILETLESIHKQFHGKTVVLFVAHPADYQAIRDGTKQWDPPSEFDIKVLNPGSMMGVPVWQTPKIKQGEIRSYLTWSAAYNDLKDILDAAHITALKANMHREAGP